ncbi:MAG: DUF333 domain-containing protein [Anaerolineae bacterium]|nr:DUF333 domain-containing protein [Anaerolineae bacterium]
MPDDRQFSSNTLTIGNPAAVYCKELGHEYVVEVSDPGQQGICKFADGSQCNQWAFLRGECGQEFNYCAQQGYDTITRADGRNPLTKTYAVCIERSAPEQSPGQEVGSATEMMNLLNKAMGCESGDCNRDDALTVEELEAAQDTADDHPLQTDPAMSVPASFDWRSYNSANWLSPIKNQASCGSCWAFAAVGAVEAEYNISTNNPTLNLDLAEQQLVSTCCSGSCSGGSSYTALVYIRDQGIVDESCMPYIAVDNSCSELCSTWASRLTYIDTFTTTYSATPTMIKEQLVATGPVVVSMGISDDFGGYFDANDVYHCTNDSGTNHAVVIVGYNNAGGYWIVRNSWGTWYEDNGYFKVGYGECKIDSYRLHTVLDEIPTPTLFSPWNDDAYQDYTVDFYFDVPLGNTYAELRLSTSPDPNAAAIVSTIVTDGNSPYQYTFNADGRYYWHMRTLRSISPAIGSDWVTHTFVLDTAAPTGALYPNTPSYLNTWYVRLCADAQDALSGISEIDFYVWYDPDADWSPQTSAVFDPKQSSSPLNIAQSSTHQSLIPTPPPPRTALDRSPATSSATGTPDWHYIGYDLYAGDGWSQLWNTYGIADQRDVHFFIYIYDWAGNSTGIASWSHTLDRNPPKFGLRSLTPRSPTQFNLWWWGYDEESSVRAFDVQYSDNGGPWTYLVNNQLIYNKTFNGIIGHTYRFRMRAYDWVGNVHPWEDVRQDVSEYATLIVAPPVNDEMANARTFSSLSYTDSRDVAGATNGVNDPQPSCGYWVGRSAWYAFTPADYTQVEVNTTGSNYDTVLSVWTGTPGNLREIGCNDDADTGYTSQVTFAAARNQTYYIMAAGYYEASGNLVLNAVPHAFCSSVTDVPATECEALWSLYAAANGEHWVNNGGWFSSPAVCGWHGVTCAAGHVTKLDLFANGLIGSLPTNLNQLSYLTEFHAGYNELGGSLPPSLGSLGNLQVLSLGKNQLDGSIPTELGNLSSLVLLHLGENNLSGSLPTSLGNLGNLQELILSYNQLDGSIPTGLTTLTNLRWLSLEGNQLSGELPPVSGWQTNLTMLSLGGNQLSGALPADLGTLTNLQYLFLDNNQFAGEIPTSITNLSALTTLVLDYNKLETSEATVDTFISSFTPNWMNTQTVSPHNLTVPTVTVESATLDWDAIAYTGDGGYYEIGYATTSGGPYTSGCQTANKSTTTCTITALDDGTTYYFAGRTYTPAHGTQQNNLLSDYANEVSATTPPRPQVPTDVSATAVSEVQIDVSWTDTNTDESNYLIERSPDGSSNWTQIGAVAADETTFSDTTLSCSVTAYYRVRAYRTNDGLYSLYSNIVSDTTILCPLVAPTNLTATGSSRTTIDLNWGENNIDETAIRIERAPTGTTSWFEIADLPADTIAYQDGDFSCGTAYDYRSRVYRNADSSYSDYSAVATGSTWSCLPASPSLIAPGNTTLVEDSTPSFTWSQTTNAARYEIQIDDNSNFSSLVQTATVSTTTYTATRLTDGLFYWRVRGLTAHDEPGAWSVVWSFTIDATTVKLTVPLDGTITNDATPTFEWEYIVDAIRYTIQIDDDPAFGSPRYTVNRLNTTYTPFIGLVDGTWYWRVRAQLTDNSWAAWSTSWRVTVDRVRPVQVVLTAPTNNATSTTNTPTFIWTGITDAINYQIQIDINQYFNTANKVEGYSNINQFIPNPPLVDRPWYWRVRAIDAAGNIGAWSASWRVYVNALPTPVPTLELPIDGALTNDRTPLFNWTDETGVVRYNIVVDDDPFCASPRLNANPIPSTYTNALVGLADGVWYWQVRALGADGNWGDFSKPWSFIVDTTRPGRPLQVAPANGSTVQVDTFALDWAALADTDGYDVQVDTNAYFNTANRIDQQVFTDVATVNFPFDGKWYWRVRAFDAAGNIGAWSTVWNVFVDAEVTPVPTLISPANTLLTRDRIFTFDWTAEAGVKRYNIQVDNETSFAAPYRINASPAADEFRNAIAPLGNGVWYWRVRAQGTDNIWGAWSDYYTLNIDLLRPARPTLATPPNGSTTTDNTPPFTWNEVGDADVVGYIIQIDRNYLFTSTEKIQQQVAGTTYTPGDPLVDRRWFWRVAAVDAVGNQSPWSPFWSVIVATTTPTADQQVIPATNPQVQRTGQWQRYTLNGRSYLASRSEAAALGLTFTGSQLTIRFAQHNTLGTFAIEIDGQVVQTVNSHTPTLTWGRVTLPVAPGEHTVRLVTLSGSVVIDAFVITP